MCRLPGCFSYQAANFMTALTVQRPLAVGQPATQSLSPYHPSLTKAEYATVLMAVTVNTKYILSRSVPS